MNTNNGGPASALYYISFVALKADGYDYGDCTIRLDSVSVDELELVRKTIRNANPRFVGPVVFLHIAKLEESPPPPSEPAPEVAETFEMFGKKWFTHSGNGCPCAPFCKVLFITQREIDEKEYFEIRAHEAGEISWSIVVGWAFAERSES